MSGDEYLIAEAPHGDFASLPYDVLLRVLHRVTR